MSRSLKTFRSARRNETRRVLKKTRADGQRTTFREVFDLMQQEARRQLPVNVIGHRPRGKVWANPGVNEAKRRAARNAN
jgi:hypothetical protein